MARGPATCVLGSFRLGPAQHSPSLLPSCHRLWGWPESSPMRVALSPRLPGPVSWEHVPARSDGLPAQLWVPPRPAVAGWPLCASRPLPLPLPAWSHGSVLPLALSQGPPPPEALQCLPAWPLPMGPSLKRQDGDGQPVPSDAPGIHLPDISQRPGPASGLGFHLPSPGSGAPGAEE